MKDLKFEYTQRWADFTEKFATAIKTGNIEDVNELAAVLETRDRDLEDHLGNQGAFQTFHRRGAVGLDESDIFWVPEDRASTLFSGGVTTYGSGTVTVALNKNGAMVAELDITASGLFTVAANIEWAAGDGMSAETTAAGVGCNGIVVHIL